MKRARSLLLVGGLLSLVGCVDRQGYPKVPYRRAEPVPEAAAPPPPPASAYAAGGSVVPVQAKSLPPGVTQAMVDEGARLFATVCVACHGPGGRNGAGGPVLADNQWIHIDGSYEQIVRIITTGVAQPRQYPAPMPPRGGGNFTDEQVRALAAYVYALSHQ